MSLISIINLFDEEGENFGEFTHNGTPQIGDVVKAPGSLVSELYRKIGRKKIYWLVRANAGYKIIDVKSAGSKGIKEKTYNYYRVIGRKIWPIANVVDIK